MKGCRDFADYVFGLGFIAIIAMGLCALYVDQRRTQWCTRHGYGNEWIGKSTRCLDKDRHVIEPEVWR